MNEIGRAVSVYLSVWSSYFWQQPRLESTKTHYVVPYTHGNQEYKILCKKARNRIRLIKITNESGDDVTDDIKPYMGPGLNFHNIPTTPIDFGHKRLVFEMLGGEQKEYEENDLILL